MGFYGRQFAIRSHTFTHSRLRDAVRERAWDDVRERAWDDVRERAWLCAKISADAHARRTHGLGGRMALGGRTALGGCTALGGRTRWVQILIALKKMSLSCLFQ